MTETITVQGRTYLVGSGHEAMLAAWQSPRHLAGRVLEAGQ